jgi:biopolymer transport protein ExbB/TolQ
MPKGVEPTFSSSQRPTREWPLLVLALALVCAVCIPLWQWSSAGQTGGDQWSSWTPERVGRLLLGPEQIACYCCFVWASFILLSRYLEVRRQRRAFTLDILPTEDGVRILPEDARPLQRKLEQSTRHGGPYILTNMIRLALGKYAVTRSSQDVSDTISTQAEVDLGRLVSSLSMVNYLAWAIPALGFLGTVRGLAGAMGMASRLDDAAFVTHVTNHLNVAFDCTLVALALSLVVMFLLHSIQRDEESLVIDCQQYCLEHLVNRLYQLEPVHELN